MPKQILFDEEGRRQLVAGTKKLAKVVRATLGPTGRTVILSKGATKSTITKDGVTVSKEIELENLFENMGAKLVNEVATKTNKEAGDGTTTSVVLAEALLSEGSRYIALGASPIALRNGMQRAAEAVVKHVGSLSRPVEGRAGIEQVAYIASNSDRQIAQVVAEAMTRVGPKGVVTVDKGEGVEPVVEYVDGLEFDKGYISPYFVTDTQTMIARLEKPLLLITDRKLSSIRDLIPILEQVVATRKPFFVVAEDVDGDALAGLIINRMRGVLACAAIKAPAFGDRRKAQLEDLAVSTGATFFSKDIGFEWENVKVGELGSCAKIEVEKGKTVFFEGAGKADAIQMRKRHIQAQIEQSTSSYDREKLEERLGKLEGKIAIIKVGGYTEAEMDERKARVEDSLSATRAAMEEGIVPGGGTAYVRAIAAAESLKVKGDERFGVDIVTQALRRPLEQLAENVGIDGPALVAEVEELSGAMGYDASARKICDLFVAGIVDPLKVVRVALLNAVSIASLSLVSDALIADLPKGKEAVAGAES